MRLTYHTKHPDEIVPSPAPETFALRFPNSQSSPQGEFCGMRLLQPQLNGLPAWGPSDAGVTYIWKCRPRSTNIGYYATFFWGQNDGGINFTNDTPYYGAHPYDFSGTNGQGTNHRWEIALDGGDVTVLESGTAFLAVTKDTVYTQALQVTHNGGTKTLRFYLNLPTVTTGSRVIATAGSGYGNSYASGMPFAVHIGDAPWAAGYDWGAERGMDIDAFMIVAKSMSQADIVTQAANFSTLNTTDSQNHIWWGKDGFEDVNDLTCDFGTGRSATYPNSNRPTLIARL